MSNLEICGGGFLTLNQSILIVVIAAVLVVISVIAIVVVSCQYNKVITTMRTTAKQMLRPAITPQPLDQSQIEEINRRNSLPRAQTDLAGNSLFPPHQNYMRSHSLPGFADYQDPRYQQFRQQDFQYQDSRYADPRNGDVRRQDPRSPNVRRTDPRTAEPRMLATGGPKKISDKPKDDASRTKPSNNREQPKEQNPSGGKKIPMRRRDADNPTKSGSRDWGQDPFYPENDRGKINPFYQESGFSDNFGFRHSDQQKMMADRYF